MTPEEILQPGDRIINLAWVEQESCKLPVPFDPLKDISDSIAVNTWLGEGVCDELRAISKDKDNKDGISHIHQCRDT
jgi:hypothetical protein